MPVEDRPVKRVSPAGLLLQRIPRNPTSISNEAYSSYSSGVYKSPLQRASRRKAKKKKVA